MRMMAANHSLIKCLRSLSEVSVVSTSELSEPSQIDSITLLDI